MPPCGRRLHAGRTRRSDSAIRSRSFRRSGRLAGGRPSRGGGCFDPAHPVPLGASDQFGHGRRAERLRAGVDHCGAAGLPIATDAKGPYPFPTGYDTPGTRARSPESGIAYVADGPARGPQLPSPDGESRPPTVRSLRPPDEARASRGTEGAVLPLTTISDDVRFGERKAFGPWWSDLQRFRIGSPSAPARRGGKHPPLCARHRYGSSTSVSAPLVSTGSGYRRTGSRGDHACGGRGIGCAGFGFVPHDEPLDPTRLALSGVKVAGSVDGLPGTDDQSPAGALPCGTRDARWRSRCLGAAGTYAVGVAPSIIVDRTGNAATARAKGSGSALCVFSLPSGKSWRVDLAGQGHIYTFNATHGQRHTTTSSREARPRVERRAVRPGRAGGRPQFGAWFHQSWASIRCSVGQQPGRTVSFRLLTVEELPWLKRASP
jgi:hypothetical protein